MANTNKGCAKFGAHPRQKTYQIAVCGCGASRPYWNKKPTP
jgi:hypothetical protein